MATNQPKNLLERQLHCVLERSSLLQYYERFIKHGECDVLTLSKAGDGKFKDVMKTVGMAKNSSHVHQFKDTLLEWAKDPDHKLHGLFRYYDDLLENTVLDKMVLDNLISRCILMIEDREEIIKPTTQRERNKVLLDILTERPYPTFHLFKDVLKESEPNNECVQMLVSRMQTTESREEDTFCHYGPEISLHNYKLQLQQNYTIFVHGVECKTDIADYLYQENVLNDEEKEEICNSLLTQQESNRLLYHKLFRKGEDSCKHLLAALRHGQYEDVASKIEETEFSDQEIQLYQIGMKKLKDRLEEKDIPRIQDEVIPKHILEQFERRLEQWKEDDQQFVSTEAEKHVMQKVLTQSSITLVGNSGTGKSFLSKHIALKMIEDGYTVIPCSKPEDIEKWFKHGRKTVFVFDDVCGRYTLNQQIYTEWKQRLDHTTSLLKDKCCKILSTCRLEVYKDEQFGNLSIFKMCSINLSSQELKLTDAEKIALAEMYFNENIDEVKELSDKYDFFPLLCSLYHKQKLKNVNIKSFFSNPFDVFKDQVVEMYGESDEGKLQYCSLVLCVMFNNTLTEENLSTKDKKMREVIEDLLEECELNRGTSTKRLKKALEKLEGTYVVKEDSTYKIIHDKLFDFLAKYLGEKMLQVFIDHAKTDFTAERFLCKITENMGTEIEFVIRIPEKYVNSYIDRLLKDWENGYVNKVCQNRNMNSTTFTENMVTRLNQLDPSKQAELVCTQDVRDKDIALGGSCYMGSVDLVKWLISKNSDISYCDDAGWFPLLWASQEGHVDVVKELLHHSADVNQYNNDDASSLYLASENGHTNVVNELLQHSANVNQCTNEDASPLYIASQNGHVGVVKELLKHSADVNKCTNDDESPLYIASQNGHVGVVKELLQHAADVNKRTNDESPLFIASQNGHINVAKELLQHSADVNQLTDDGVSPLSIASQNGNIDVVNELLKHAADVNLCNNAVVSPLYLASESGHINVAKTLLKHSADVNQCTDDDASPLYIASQNGHVDVVKEMIQHSADVNKCTNDDESPLFIASQNGHVDVAKELLQHSADVNKCTNDDESPLYIASQNGHVDVVKELLQHAADVNKCTNNESPLFIASQNGHINVAKELLQHSADVNKCTNDDESPLFIASKNGHVDVAKELLQHSADVNKCTNVDESPIFIASQNGHVNVVKELLKHSADVNKSTNDDESPLLIASKNGHVDVVTELLQHSADVNHCDFNGRRPLSIALD
ncbi:uncharacterized protein [Mytilus edulis]|uniref:uncharacterized protein n=1 Tax=Mytilus edulis TaxID=6550 RepID=UPI0039EF7E66